MSNAVVGGGHPLRSGRPVGSAALAAAGGAALAAILTVLAGGPAGAAALNPAPVQTESVLLVPSPRGVAVFQEVRFAHASADPAVGILQGAQALKVEGARPLQQHPGWVVLAGRPLQATLTYRLSSATQRFRLTAFGAIGTLYLASAAGHRFPARQNPDLVFLGHGPVLPGSATVFNTYRTDNVHSGQTLVWTWRAGNPGTVAPTGPRPAAAPTGTTTMAGAVAAAALAALAGFSWLALYLRWRRVQAVLGEEARS